MAAILPAAHSKNFFLYDNCCIFIHDLLKFIPKAQIDNKVALAQIMTWRCTGDKPISGIVMA